MEKKSLRKILQNVKRRNRGITLIALVLTIVILIILATITINFAFGENGLVGMTEDARDITTEATEKEGIEMAVADSKIKDITTPDREKENLEESLRSQFGNDVNFTVTENGDGSFLITMNDSQRSYYVESTGKIIAQSEMIEIGTAEELKAFRDDVNNGNTYEGKYIRLTNNITLDIGEEWEPIGLYPNESSTPDNENNKPFSGTFDGCGYEINGIYINTTDKVQGLFGLVNNGKILNLGIGKNCNISGGTGTAGLVGYIFNGSIINTCYNEANINGSGSNTGGVVGIAYTSCKIINVYNTGNIGTTSDDSGGIVGYISNDVSIQNSYNIGVINGKSNVGGIFGRSVGSMLIESCYNAGNITGATQVGGITGSASGLEGMINQCYNTGNIEASDKNTSGNSNVGGIVGISGGNITNCYNTGIITGKYNNIGGLIGLNRGTLENSYNIGDVSGSVEVIGSIIGNNNEFYVEESNVTYIGKTYNSYSLEGITEKLFGTNNSIVGEECSVKSSTELQQLYNTLGNCFKEDIEKINAGYPILSWQ